MTGEPDWRRRGESVDRLVTTEVRVRGNLPSGIVGDLYRAARDEADGPLSYTAAQSLHRAVDPGDTVVVATGAGGPPWLPAGETDGPPGAVGLARALALALGARPVLTAEEHAVAPVRAAARACGLNVVPYEQLVERDRACAVVPYPKDRAAGEETADRFLETYDPAAVVAVEKGGPNAEGVYHSATGSSMDPHRAKIAPLFDRAADAGLPTVGVGDNGNEIGFGRIEREARGVLPHGETCECPCEGGVVSRVATDHLVVANTSNWGAHGTSALLAALADAPDAFHSPAEESRMLEAVIREGASDGVSARPVPKVDGTSEATQRGVVAVLADIVATGRTEITRGF